MFLGLVSFQRKTVIVRHVWSLRWSIFISAMHLRLGFSRVCVCVKFDLSASRSPFPHVAVLVNGELVGNAAK